MRAPSIAGLLVLLTGTAAAQDAPPPGVATEPAAPTRPADPDPDIQGARARIRLKRGPVLEGVLPRGQAWERRTSTGSYVDARSGETGSGLRLYFLMGMEGAIFVRQEDIAEVKEMGVLTEDQKAAIQEGIFAERRRIIEERQRKIDVELAKILPAGTKPTAAPNPSPAPAASEAKAPASDAGTAKPTVPAPAPGKPDPAAERRRRGDALLEKFPSPEWSDDRASTILYRERVADVQRDTVEAEFLENFDLWKEALRRKEEAEAAATKAAADAAAAALRAAAEAEAKAREAAKSAGPGAKK